MVSAQAGPRQVTRRRAWLGGGAVLVVGALIGAGTTSAAEAPIGLGTAASYAVLAGTGVTNTGPSVVNGDLGTCPTPAITGFPPGDVNGTIHANDAAACQAKDDLVTAYNDAASRPPSVTYPGPTDLGTMTLLQGVYTSPSSLGITGTLTLDAEGDPAAVFIFQAGSTLITAPNSTVALVNGAQACNVFWLVGSSATLGVGSTFVGTVIALTSITANTTATIEGRLLARNGAVTLDTNTINVPTCAPAPTTTAAPTTSTTTAGATTTSTTTAPGATTTTAAPVTTTTAPGATTTTAPAATTTTAPGATTTTAAPATTSTTAAPGATTTTALGVTTTTTAPGATTTTAMAATTTTVGSGTDLGTGATTTTTAAADSGNPGATTTTTSPTSAAATTTTGSAQTTTTSATGGGGAGGGGTAGGSVGTQTLVRTGSPITTWLALSALALVLGTELLLLGNRRRRD